MLPNTLIRSYLHALEDLLGKNGVNAILNLSKLSDWIESYPPDDDAKEVPNEVFPRIQAALEDIYGARMGQNISHRAARSSFMQVGPGLTSLDPVEVTGAPPIGEIEKAFHVFSTLFSPGPPTVQVINAEKGLVLEFQDCPNCHGREADEPICQACVGWIEGLLTLIGAGDELEVVETSCLAAGDASCTFSISKG